MTVFNKTLITTKDNLKALETINATVYNKNGAFNLQGLSVNTSQSVSNFTKLNNAFNVYNGNLSKSTQLQNAYVKAVGSQNVALGNYLAGLNGAKASMGGYITSLIGAKAATIGLQVASVALNAAISMGLSLAISALVSAITKWVNKEKEARESAIESAKSAKEESNNLSNLLNQYNKLSKEVKTNSGVKEDLLSVQSDLLEALGIEASQIDTLIEKYGNLDTAINQVTLDSLQEAQADLMGAVDAYEKELLDTGADGLFGLGANNTISASGDDVIKAFDVLKKSGVAGDNSYLYDSGVVAFNLNTDGSSIEEILQNYQQLKDAQEALNAAVEDGTFTMDEMKENPLYKSINTRLKEVETAVERYNTSVDDLNKNIAQQQILNSIAEMDSIPETKEEFESFKQSMIDTAVASTKFIGSQDDVRDSIINVLSTMPEFEKYFEDIKDKSETFNNEIDVSFPDSLKNIFGEDSSLSDFTGEMEKLGGYLTKLKNNTITTEDIIALQDMGIAGDSIEDIREQLEDLMNTNLDGIIDKIDELIASSANEETKQKLQTLKETLEEYNQEVQNTKEPSILSGNSTKDFQKLSGGFDQLDKIYADVYDKESFDWSSILNNDEFFDTFGSFEDEYNSFIDTISNSPSDISACQDSFNNLVTAYVNGSGVLDEVTEATKASTIAQMEQMGITNASAVVEEHLTANEQKRELETRAVTAATSDMSGVTQTATQDLLSESNMSDLARAKLYQLVAQQTIFNNQTLDVGGKISALAQLAKQYGDVATAALASAAAQKADAYARAMATDEGASYTDSLKEYLESTYNDLVGSVNNFAPVNYAPQVSYAGGSATQSAKDAANSAKDSAKDASEEAENTFSEFFDWMEFRLNKLQRSAEKVIDKVTNSLQYAMKKGIVTKAFKNINKEMQQYVHMAESYQKQADSIGLDSYWVKLIKGGQQIDFSTITDEGLANQIKDYKEWYEKSLDCIDANEDLKDTIKEVSEAIAQAPIDKAAEKVEKLESAIELLDAKIANNTSASGKNTKLDEKITNIDSTLNVYSNALNNSNTNLKTYRTAVKGQKVAKGATKDEKKKFNNLMAKVKNFAKSGKPITDKVLDNIYSYCSSVGDFSWYENAVAYNAALEAKQSALETYQLYKQTSETEQREITKEKFDNVATEYENKIQVISNGMTDLDNTISEIETRGTKVNANYYRSQKQVNDQMLSSYQAEKSALEGQIANIKQGTEEWYDALQQIQDVEDAISSCVQKTYELNDTIRELHFNTYEEAKSDMEKLIEEQELLQTLISHEKFTDSETGTYTAAGVSMLGSLGAEASTYQAELEYIRKQREELERMKASGTLTSDLFRFNFNSIDQLDEKLEEIQADEIDVLTNFKGVLDEIVDLSKEAIESEMDMMKELIGKRKDALNAEKSLYDYQRQISEKTSNISSLQKQIAAYTGNSSEEGKMNVQRLNADLQKAQQDLQDTEYDRYLQDTEDMLDELYAEYEELITKKMDDYYALLEDAMKIANEYMDGIDIYMDKVATTYGYTQQFPQLFGMSAENANAGIATSIDGLSSTFTTGVNAINNSFTTQIDKLSKVNLGFDNENLKSTLFGTIGDNVQKITDDILKENGIDPKTGETNDVTNGLSSVGATTSTGDIKAGLQQPVYIEDNSIGTTEATKPQVTDADLRQMAIDFITSGNKLKDKEKIKKQEQTLSETQKKIANGYNGKTLNSDNLRTLANKLEEVSGQTITGKHGFNDGADKNDLFSVLKRIGVPGFAQGGIVSVDDLQRQVKANGDSVLVSANKGEGFLTPVQTSMFQELLDGLPALNMATDMMANLAKVNVPDYSKMVVPRETSGTIGDVQFNFDLSGCQSPADIIKTIQTDRKVQQAIRSVTIDQIAGKTRLSVNQIK